MFKYTEGDVSIKGVKIHYYRTGGKKPPFILLHGATDNGLCWTPIAEVLAENYDVIMPDAQGHGLSDRFGDDAPFENSTHQVAGLAKALKLKKPLIMGHSMGAGTATNVAVVYPDLPRAVILEDPGWNTPNADPKMLAERQKQMKAMMDAFTDLRHQSQEEALAFSHKFNPGWPEAELLPWIKSKLQFDTSLFSRMVLNPKSYEELVPKMDCPTLLLTSEKGIVSKATAENAAKIWKSKQPFKWVYIKGAGHNIRRENFKDFMAAVSGFLQEIKI
jgi:N-formylmaleamate deformylase